MLVANRSNRDIVLKARQFGISTICLIQQLDFVLFNENVTACILADEQDSIKKLFEIPTQAYHSMPDEIKPKLAKGGGSKYEMFFPKYNSRIYCDLESHGDTIQNLHVSEAPMCDKSRLDSTLQAVPIVGGRVTLEGTPKGLNWFYDEWNNKESTYKKHFYPWFFHDEYSIPIEGIKLTKEEIIFKEKTKRLFNIDITDAQINFRRFKKMELKDAFLEQYPEDDETCFIKSGDNFFDIEKIKVLLNKTPKQDDSIIKIFKSKTPTGHYVIGCDTAEGVGGDYSTASVIDVTTMEEVGFLRCKLKPSEFAHKVIELAKTFQHGHKVPEICVERNNHGHAVILELQEHIKWPNLYSHTDDRIGWVTDRVTRPIMLNAFRDCVENGSVKINNAETLRECLTFINKNGKITSEEGKHDDCIIACSIAIQMAIKKSSVMYERIGEKILL